MSVRERAEHLWQKHDDCSDDWCATEGHNVCEVIWPVAELRDALDRIEQLEGELAQRRQLLTEWFALWEKEGDLPVKLDNALHIRTALTLNTPEVVLALNPKEADE